MNPERLQGFLDAANILSLHGMQSAATIVLNEAERRSGFGCLCTLTIHERMEHPECPVHAPKTEPAPALSERTDDHG